MAPENAPTEASREEREKEIARQKEEEQKKLFETLHKSPDGKFIALTPLIRAYQELTSILDERIKMSERGEDKAKLPDRLKEVARFSFENFALFLAEARLQINRGADARLKIEHGVASLDKPLSAEEIKYQNLEYLSVLKFGEEKAREAGVSNLNELIDKQLLRLMEGKPPDEEEDKSEKQQEKLAA